MNKLDQGSYTVGPYSFVFENHETGEIWGERVVGLTPTVNGNGMVLLSGDQAIELAAKLMMAADKC